MKLKKHLIKMAKNSTQNLKRVIAGMVIFFAGAAGLIWSEGATHLEPLHQELVALLALAVMGVGALIALVGYLALSVFRIIKFLDDKDDNGIS
jgi:hypothetical protein